MTVRWIFSDPGVPETYTVHINPNESSSPYQSRNLVYAAGTGAALNRIRAVDQPPQQAKEWSFSGVFRDKAHHDELLRWARKGAPIQITDHLGRTFEVMIRSFEPTDRRSMATVPWRGRYTMTCLLIGALP